MHKITQLFLSCLFLLAISGKVDAQTITTLAGKGTPGYYGNGSSALTANLHWPQGVAIDDTGNMYIADALNNVVRKVSTNGKISTIAGTGWEFGTGLGGFAGDFGPATAARLWGPSGVAVDKHGFIYIADHNNNRIRKIDTGAGHMITTLAGNGFAGFSGDGASADLAQLSHPNRVVVDTFGTVFIADTGNHVIRMVDTLGMITTVAGTGAVAGYSGDGGAATAATMNHPVDVAVDLFGNLYIVDMYNYVIRKVSISSGNISTICGIGTPGFSGDGRAATTAQLYDPSAICVDHFGAIYISDLGNMRIRKIDVGGKIRTIAGKGVSGFSGDGGPATAAELMFPNGLAVNAFGNVCFADQGNNRIRFMSITLGANSIDNTDDGLTLYPNPCQGLFNINIPSAMNELATVVITNAAGVKVKELILSTNTENQVEFNPPPGIYFISANTSQDNWNQKLLVK